MPVVSLVKKLEKKIREEQQQQQQRMVREDIPIRKGMNRQRMNGKFDVLISFGKILQFHVLPIVERIN